MEAKIVNQAKKLFLCYSLVQKLNISEPTLAKGPYSFIDKKQDLNEQMERI